MTARTDTIVDYGRFGLLPRFLGSANAGTPECLALSSQLASKTLGRS
jgi:hypothetical protein